MRGIAFSLSAMAGAVGLGGAITGSSAALVCAAILAAAAAVLFIKVARAS